MEKQPAAIVTGSSRGIGRAIATRLARCGYGVVVNFVSSVEKANAVVAEIEASGGQAIAVRGDVGCSEDREQLLAACQERFGRLDLLVNNAGIAPPERIDLLSATEVSWEKVFTTNLKGPFFLSQQAANWMIRQISQGVIPAAKIINISSISAYAGSRDRADYCMAKAGLAMMTQLLAARLAEESVQVFEICPGIIRTDMTEIVADKYDALIEDGLMPIRRWGEATDVAEAVRALVENRFPFSTGQRFHVDGGYHLRRL
ncbi:MAG: 3-ketoacyl-ACP reductase [Planctomycetota bacterium]|nr:3-ketoacyl-ACP reductase [Planctomycetota bacterium]